MTTIDTDYLVIGAGASGMSFTDTMLEQSDAEVVLVDRRHRPGGHWNDAYPFVRLHQPAATYGVCSRPFEVHHPDPDPERENLAAGHEARVEMKQALKEARDLGSPTQLWRTLIDAAELGGLDAAQHADEALAAIDKVITDLNSHALAASLRASFEQASSAHGRRRWHRAADNCLVPTPRSVSRWCLP